MQKQLSLPAVLWVGRVDQFKTQKMGSAGILNFTMICTLLMIAMASCNYKMEQDMCAMNDPLGQTHSPTSGGFVLQILKSGDRRTDERTDRQHVQK